MELRPAELEDLPVCAGIAGAIASRHVWQLSVSRDPAAALATSEFSITLRCLRLPREVTVIPAGEPLERIWQRAAAVFVAAAADTLAGFVVLTLADEQPAAMVSRLIVAPTFRRRGVGAALLHTAARWAASEGLASLLAHCSTRNHPAVAFLTRSGFTFAGFNEAYYPNGEIALFWHRTT